MLPFIALLTLLALCQSLAPTTPSSIRTSKSLKTTLKTKTTTFSVPTSDPASSQQVHSSSAPNRPSLQTTTRPKPLRSSHLHSGDFFDTYYSLSNDKIYKHDLLSRARQQRNVRHSIALDISVLNVPVYVPLSPGESASPVPKVPIINSDLDIEQFDSVHNHVNEEIKFRVREYSSAVEMDLENHLKQEAKGEGNINWLYETT